MKEVEVVLRDLDLELGELGAPRAAYPVALRASTPPPCLGQVNKPTDQQVHKETGQQKINQKSTNKR